jgi:hypothetical protein
MLRKEHGRLTWCEITESNSVNPFHSDEHSMLLEPRLLGGSIGKLNGLFHRPRAPTPCWGRPASPARHALTTSRACCILAFLRVQRVRVAWCSQYTLGSSVSCAQVPQRRETAAHSKSCRTPAHQKSTSAAKAGNCFLTLCIAA